MDFALGLLVGMIIMGAIAQRLKVFILNEIEELKDFEVWKEWKNKSE
jgi:hypothetical protein